MRSDAGRAAELLARWLSPGGSPPRALVVAAHPDDDVIGLGAHLESLRNPVVVYVTDGAPRDMADALRAGFDTRDAYAAARRDEALRALALAGIDERQVVDLDVPDQEAVFAVPEITRSLQRLFAWFRPELVLTHPYEGGHPDHDAAALATRLAWRALPVADRPALAEFSSYHRGPAGALSFDFLPFGGIDPLLVPLGDEARERKRRLFACHESQMPVLRWFPLDAERFRPAPSYDFTRPPHRGPLHYEQFSWGVDAAGWRRAAAEAAAELAAEADRCA